MTSQAPQLERHMTRGFPLTNGSPARRIASPAVGERPLWKKILCLVAAGAFFVIGVLGSILPGLPATPFLLLTSFFLVRCSPRLNSALLRSRFFGPILVDWQVHGGIRRSVRIKATIAVAFAVGLTIWLSGYSALPAIGVVTFASIGVAVIFRLPTVR